MMAVQYILYLKGIYLVIIIIRHQSELGRSFFFVILFLLFKVFGRESCEIHTSWMLRLKLSVKKQRSTPGCI